MSGMNYYIYSATINFVTALALCIFVFLKNPRIKTNRIFSLFCLSIAWWSFFYLFWISAGSEELGAFFVRTCMLGVLFMPILPKAGKIKVIYVITTAIAIMLLTAYIHHLKSVPTLQRPSAPVQTDSQSEEQTEDEESTPGEHLPLGSLLGYNKPAIPPMTMPVKRPASRDDSPDLSTPAAAVYSVLSLIDQAAIDKLAPCFIEKTEDTVDNLYPRYLGHPVELVDVAEEDDYAEVIWNATVHTMLSLDGRNRSPGETITLKTQLVRVEGLWKLVKLHNGGQDVPQ